MNNANNKKRWEILDRMLGQGEPVTSDDVYTEWSANGIRPKNGDARQQINSQYALLFRQDLLSFQKAYEECGLGTEPFSDLFIKGFDPEDSRKRTYMYSRPSFSIMPCFNERYSRSDWAKLDGVLNSLGSTLPETMAAKVDFLVRSRLDVIRGESGLVDWSESTRAYGYDIAPEIYRYVRTKTPFLCEYGNNREKIVVHPYLMKKYRNHWYCFGYRPDKQELWPVSLSGILFGSVRPKKDEKFIEYTGEMDGSRIAYFDNCIGVTKEYNENTAKNYLVSEKEYDIVLGIHDPKVWWYLNADPIHPSMKVVQHYSREKEYGRVSFRVITNREMYKNLLYLGPGVVVESPSFARDIMKQMISDMYRGYK